MVPRPGSPRTPSTAALGFKDSEARNQRQARRFRLYGLDRGGQVAGKVTAAYVDRLLADFARVLWVRHAYYLEEQRRPGSPFWARRHNGPGADPRRVGDARALAGTA